VIYPPLTRSCSSNSQGLGRDPEVGFHCDKVIRTQDIVFEPTKFYDSPQGYIHESVIEEVIELLLFPEELEPDDIAIEDLLSTLQCRQRQTADALALSESQGGGDQMERYNDGLLTPGPSTSDQQDGQNQNDSLSFDSEQLAHEQQLSILQKSQDLSATQIEGYCKALCAQRT
jgi:hypothetical protein